MCKFYNGKEITADNLKAEILDYTNNLNSRHLSKKRGKSLRWLLISRDDIIEFIMTNFERTTGQANLQTLGRRRELILKNTETGSNPGPGTSPGKRNCNGTYNLQKI